MQLKQRYIETGNLFLLGHRILSTAATASSTYSRAEQVTRGYLKV